MRPYEKAIINGPFFIEPYLSLAGMTQKKGDPETALEWLEKGRPYLKRPLICKGMQLTGDDILNSYQNMHLDLIIETHSQVPAIHKEELMVTGQRFTKIGRNEKCPCGSGKKYKKCCMTKR